MIAALGCKYVILGHSERRQYYGETSATLNKKMAQAYANGLTPIYCVGENLEEREAGKHFDVVKAQIEEVVYNLTEEEYKNLVIAYEPVWAIGTGKTASAEQAQEIHAYIRKVLAAKNVREKDFDVDGFLNVLEPYYKNGEYGYLLNSDKELDLLNKRFIVFELDVVKDNPILFPVVTIIIMETFINKMRRLQGIRKMILIEEA